MDDEFDIYNDLEEFDWEQKYLEQSETLKEEQSKALTALNRISALENDILKFKELNENLKHNMTVTLTTFSKEVARKDGQILQLRKEKDNICFRRAPPTNNFKIPKKAPSFSFGTQTDLVYNISTTTQTEFSSPEVPKTQNDKNRKNEPERDAGKYDNRNSNRNYNNNKYPDREETRKKKDFDDRNSRYRTNDRSRYEPKLIQEPKKNDRHFSRREDDRSDKRKWSPERNNWDSNKRGRYERKDAEPSQRQKDAEPSQRQKDAEPSQRQKDDDLMELEDKLAAIRKAIESEKAENCEPKKERSVHSDDSKKSRSDDGQRKPMKSRRMSVYVKELSIEEFTSLPVPEETVSEEPSGPVVSDVKDQLQKVPEESKSVPVQPTDFEESSRLSEKVPDEKMTSEPLPAVSFQKQLQKSQVPEDKSSKKDDSSVKSERLRERENKSDQKSSRREENPFLEPTFSESSDDQHKKSKRSMKVLEVQSGLTEQVPFVKMSSEPLPAVSSEKQSEKNQVPEDKSSKRDDVSKDSSVKSERSRERENKSDEKSSRSEGNSKNPSLEPSFSESSDDQHKKSKRSRRMSVHEKKHSDVEKVPEIILAAEPLSVLLSKDQTQTDQVPNKLSKRRDDNQPSKGHSVEPRPSREDANKQLGRSREEVREEEKLEEKSKETSKALSESSDERKSKTSRRKSVHEKEPSQNNPIVEKVPEQVPKDTPVEPKSLEKTREEIPEEKKSEVKSKDLSVEPSKSSESSENKKSKKSRRMSVHERKHSQDIPVVAKVPEPLPSVESKEQTQSVRDRVSDERSSQISKGREENKTSDYDSSLGQKKESRSRSKEVPVHKKEKPSPKDLDLVKIEKVPEEIRSDEKSTEKIKEVSETEQHKVLPVEPSKEPHKKSRRDKTRQGSKEERRGSKEPSSEPSQSDSSIKSKYPHEKVPEQKKKSSEPVSKVSSEQVPEDKSSKRSRSRKDKTISDSRKPKEPSLEPSVSKSEKVPEENFSKEVPISVNGQNIPEDFKKSIPDSVEPLHSEVSKIQEKVEPLQSETKVQILKQTPNVPIKDPDLPLEPTPELSKDLRFKAKRERRKSIYVPEQEKPDVEEDSISKFTGRNKKSKMSRRMSIFFGDDSVDESVPQKVLPKKTEDLPKKTEDHSDINLIINKKTGKVRRSSECVPVQKEEVREDKVSVPKQESPDVKSKTELPEITSKEKVTEKVEKSKKSSKKPETEEKSEKSIPPMELPTIIVTAAARKSFDQPKVEELQSILKSPCSKSPAKKKVRISDEFIPQPTKSPQSFTNMADLLNTPMKAEVPVVEQNFPANETIIYLKSRKRSSKKVVEEAKPIENVVVCPPQKETVVEEAVKPTNQVLKSIENSSEVVCPLQKETVANTVETTEKRKSNGTYTILEVVGSETVIMLNRKRKKKKN